MRPFVLLSGLMGFASAAPLIIDIAAINAFPSQAEGPAPTVTKQLPTYNPTVAAKKIEASMVANPLTRQDVAARREMLESRGLLRRAGNCAPYSQGYAPKTLPDTAEAFLSNPIYTDIALNATAPSGYDVAFQNFNASVNQPGYMGVITFQHYSVAACQGACDGAPGCTAFNMYIERSPSRDTGNGCPNPPAVFNFRCTLWGQTITASTAINDGQFRGPTDGNGTAFRTMIAASNAYVKDLAAPSFANFSSPVALAGALQQPSTAAANSYIGQRSWPGIHDPSLCAAACQATTSYDKAVLVRADGAYTPCNFFNSYVVSKNGVPQGTTCAFFSAPVAASFASSAEQFDGAGNRYTVSKSFAYALSTPDLGVVEQ